MSRIEMSRVCSKCGGEILPEEDPEGSGICTKCMVNIPRTHIQAASLLEGRTAICSSCGKRFPAFYAWHGSGRCPDCQRSLISRKVSA